MRRARPLEVTEAKRRASDPKATEQDRRASGCKVTVSGRRARGLLAVPGTAAAPQGERKMEQLSHWLEKRCQKEGLSLRQAAAKTGLSHATIYEIRRGSPASAQSVVKLAQAFGGDGQQRLVLEDELLILAGYRTPRPEGEEFSEALAELIDNVGNFTEPQIQVINRFVKLFSEFTPEMLGGD